MAFLSRDTGEIPACQSDSRFRVASGDTIWCHEAHRSIKAREPGMRKRTADVLAVAARAIMLSLSLALLSAGCSQAPCERTGTCYNPPTTFYGGSYYQARGGFVFAGGKSR